LAPTIRPGDAVKAASLVDVLSNAGPFTVFAPTNAAFDKLPAGTVEGLLKPDQKDALSNILEYHVYVGVIKPMPCGMDSTQSGQRQEHHPECEGWEVYSQRKSNYRGFCSGFQRDHPCD
jgi:uncharacterized surface protein with fasciclin (FAS1) repeats